MACIEMCSTCMYQGTRECIVYAHKMHAGTHATVRVRVFLRHHNEALPPRRLQHLRGSSRQLCLNQLVRWWLPLRALLLQLCADVKEGGDDLRTRRKRIHTPACSHTRPAWAVN